MKISELIISSFRVCKVLAKGEAPTADEMQDAVQALQLMLDLWGADNLMVWSYVEEFFPLVFGKRIYTIGLPSGDFATAYPYAIKDAYITDGNQVVTGIDILTRTEYNGLADKFISVARPQSLFYEPGVANQISPLGTLAIYPIPDGSTAYTLYLTSQKPLIAAIASTQDFTLLAPYGEAIKYNLVLRLWDEYHEKDPIPQHIERLALESKHVIERNSMEFEIAPMSLPGIRTGIWNILSDCEN